MSKEPEEHNPDLESGKPVIYNNGGIKAHRSHVHNASGYPEAILTHEQWRQISGES